MISQGDVALNAPVNVRPGEVGGRDSGEGLHWIRHAILTQWVGIRQEISAHVVLLHDVRQAVEES